MADKKITDLVADVAPDGADLTITVDDVAGTPTTKKATLSNLAKAFTSPSGTLAAGTTRAISTTAPLTGGGDLSADRTLAVSGATALAQGVLQLAGDLQAGSAAAPQVAQARGLRETAGPTTLAMGAVADGQFLKRSGATVIGAAAGSEAAANARTRRLLFR